jgi:hypothetical protein
MEGPDAVGNIEAAAAREVNQSGRVSSVAPCLMAIR